MRRIYPVWLYPNNKSWYPITEKTHSDKIATVTKSFGAQSQSSPIMLSVSTQRQAVQPYNSRKGNLSAKNSRFIALRSF